MQLPQNLNLSNASKSGDIAASWRQDAGPFTVTQGGISNETALMVGGLLVAAVVLYRVLK